MLFYLHPVFYIIYPKIIEKGWAFLMVYSKAPEKGGAGARARKLLKGILVNYELYLFLLPAVIVVLVFNYAPMYGVQIAFKDFVPSKGILGSPWVGFKHFERFFNSYQFGDLIWNTLSLSLYSLIAGFPMPILLALMINQMRGKYFKKTLQTVTYMPHFISTVVIVGMINLFLSSTTGLYGNIMRLFGAEAQNILGNKDLFQSIYVWSSVWQETGWDSIIYLAALSGVDMSLHEAATVDGANKLQRIWHIDIPSILPTAVILLILRAGGLMSLGFEKAFLMQNPLNTQKSEIISTYVYKVGIISSQYSFSAAVGLFNTVINFTLLIIVNGISRKFSETSLW